MRFISFNHCLTVIVTLYALLLARPILNIYAEGPSDPAPILNSGGIGGVVCFDNTHGSTSGQADWVLDGAFSDFANALTGAGYNFEVREIRKEIGTALTTSDLSPCKVYVMAEPQWPLKDSEKQVLSDYVLVTGGSVLFIADHYNADRNKNRFDGSEVFNGYRRCHYSTPTAGMSAGEASASAMSGVSGSDWLSSVFGVRFRYNALGDGTTDSSLNPSLPTSGSPALNTLLSGVTSASIHAGSTLAITDPNKAKGLLYLPTSITSWGSAVELSPNVNNPSPLTSGVYNGGGVAEGPFVAISKPGKGKGAFIGDSSPVEDISPKYKREDTGATKTTHAGWQESNNAQLLLNLVKWLATYEPTITSLAGYTGLALDSVTTLHAIEDPVSGCTAEPDNEPWSAPPAGYSWYDRTTFKSGSYGFGTTSGTPPPPPPPPSATSTSSFLEDFEVQCTQSAYSSTSGVDVTLPTGIFTIYDTLCTSTVAGQPDHQNGNGALRIRNTGAVEQKFNVGGARQVKFSYAMYGTDSATSVSVSLYQSTDNGVNWGSALSSWIPSSSLQQAVWTFNPPISSNVRFRIAVVGGTTSKRVNIDDIIINYDSPTEDFDNGGAGFPKSAYTAADITLDSGVWNMDNCLTGNIAGQDRFVGSYSVRCKENGKLTMKFDKQNPAYIKVYHAKFNTDASSTWSLWVCTNSICSVSTDWTKIGSDVTTSSTTLTLQSFYYPVSGAARFQIQKSSTTSRINFDDVIIVDSRLENFDAQCSDTAYGSSDVLLISGLWNLNNALCEVATSGTAGGNYFGIDSIRVKSAGSIQMLFTTPSASMVSVSHRNWYNAATSTFDSGATWTLHSSSTCTGTFTQVAGSSTYTPTNSFVRTDVTIGSTGPMCFKIVVSGTSGKRINFDNFIIV